jgi:hypothetical protein
MNLPLYTDDSILFLDNYIENFLKGVSTYNVLEFGGGMSTLYYLEKGFNVFVHEPSIRWKEIVINISKIRKLSGKLNFIDIDFDFLKNRSFEIIAIDSNDKFTKKTRMEIFEFVNKYLNNFELLIIDNTERKRYYKIFEELTNLNFINFEQKSFFCNKINSYKTLKTSTVRVLKHRWITTIFFKKNVSNYGNPLY